jgi:hypothetical protein
MEASAIETKWAPIAILGLSGIASWHPYQHAWQWVLATSLVLAVLLLMRAYVERERLSWRPKSVAVTGFVASKIILPLLVISTGFAGLIADNDALMEVALLNSVALAIAALL